MDASSSLLQRDAQRGDGNSLLLIYAELCVSQLENCCVPRELGYRDTGLQAVA